MTHDLDHASQIFKSFKILKLQDIVQFSIIKLIYLCFNDLLSLQVKSIFIQNESVNPHITAFFTSQLILVQNP